MLLVSLDQIFALLYPEEHLISTSIYWYYVKNNVVQLVQLVVYVWKSETEREDVEKWENE